MDFLQKTTQTKRATFFSLPLLVDKDTTSINIRDKKKHNRTMWVGFLMGFLKFEFKFFLP